MAGKKKHGKANVYGKGGVFIGTVRTVTAVDGVFRLHQGDILRLSNGSAFGTLGAMSLYPRRDAMKHLGDEEFATRARALLKRIEWSARREGDDETECCIECWATKAEGHNAGCELAALVGEAP